MSQQVDFFFSPASRYSYLAATQINRLERETGCTVVWRPVHGPDIRKLRGRDPFDGSALSGQYEPEYRQADAAAWAAFYGVAYHEPREPRVRFRAARARRGDGAASRRRRRFPVGDCARRYTGAGRWPLDEALLLELSTAHGIARESLRAGTAFGGCRCRTRRDGARGLRTRRVRGSDVLHRIAHVLGQRSPRPRSTCAAEAIEVIARNARSRASEDLVHARK